MMKSVKYRYAPLPLPPPQRPLPLKGRRYGSGIIYGSETWNEELALDGIRIILIGRK